MVLAAGAAPAQSPPASVRIYTDPPNVPIFVDGVRYPASVTFLWPAGSKHTLAADPYQTAEHVGTRYAFIAWYAGGTAVSQPGPVITFTADPTTTSVHAEFGTEYLLALRFFSCPDGGCQSPGTVYVDGVRCVQDQDLWRRPGAVVQLEAVPSPGYVFLGWGLNADGGPQSMITSAAMRGPMSLTPRFEVARRVRLDAQPSGLKLLADRNPVMTPITLEWGRRTVHALAPITPQDDANGKTWVFQGWSDGALAVRSYTVSTDDVVDSVTARFVPGARVTVLTNPPGLRLRIDGRENWPSYSFSWGVGETHRIEAAAQQPDAQGRTYQFRGWTNGAAAAQELTVTDADTANGIRLTAQYEMLGRVVIQSSVAGVSATVDGAECPTPCQMDRPVGSTIRVEMPPSLPVGEGARYDFQNWADGGAAGRTFTATADVRTFTAAYLLMNRLATAADPPEGVAWHRTPDSPDGFYDAKSTVALWVESQPGYRFRRFEGDLSGSYNAGTLAMAVPRAVRAVTDRVPYVAPAGVRNAAGTTPVDAVAPGSVIAIQGVNLAGDRAAGPDSPLAQALGDVTVRLADRLLPLFFVSPGQINAQLPSDVPEGAQSLVVRWEGKPEVQAGFTVARNAPGLFGFDAGGITYAAASHEDGTDVTPDSPARRGETVTLYGTGFGPCTPRPLDGFAVPDKPYFALLDGAEVVAGDAALTPRWAGAAPGRVGVNAVRFEIATDLAPDAASVPIKVRVNGQESNTVVLPVQQP